MNYCSFSQDLSTEAFNAAQMCCACSGGSTDPDTGECTSTDDGSNTDMSGNNCASIASIINVCNRSEELKNDDFDAATMCCACACQDSDNGATD